MSYNIAFMCKYCGQYHVTQSNKHPYESKVRCKNGSCKQCDKPYAIRHKGRLNPEIIFTCFKTLSEAQAYVKVKNNNSSSEFDVSFS